MLRILLPLLWLAVCTTGIAQPAPRNGRDYAVFFVAATYENGWSNLRDAPAEVQNIATELRERYGFEVRIVPDAKRADIVRVLGEYKQKKYKPQDQLLLFFSMHGVHDKDSDQGYLIPKDGLLQDFTYESWYSHAALRDLAGSMPCNRVLVALDACYSGIFGGHRDDNRPTPAWEREDYLCTERLIKAFNANKTRKYLTAGGDVRVPAKSVFAARWLAALRSDGGDDGLLGFHELLGTLDQFQEPRPTAGDFVAETNGDFVFVKKNGCAAISPSPMEKAPGSEVQNSFQKDLSAWEKAKAFDTPAAYQKYLDDFPGGSFREAADAKIAAAKSRVVENKPEPVTPVQNKTDDGLVLVRGGAFTMGCTSEQQDCYDSDKPAHSVTLSDFYIGRHEVTQKLWTQVMGSINPSYFKGDDLPVENVSWEDVQDFLKKLNAKLPAGQKPYRLPTEAEWEYAARQGGQAVLFGNGKNIADPVEINFDGDYDVKSYSIKGIDRQKTTPVGSFAPNSLGLYDMSGNVWEWCNDWYGDYTSGSQTNPQGPGSGVSRVIRGGYWGSFPRDCRVAYRGHGTPADRGSDLGFRLARSF